MNTAVLITLIVCITLVIVCAFETLNKYIETKKPRTLFEMLGIENKEDKE